MCAAGYRLSAIGYWLSAIGYRLLEKMRVLGVALALQLRHGDEA